MWISMLTMDHQSMCLANLYCTENTYAGYIFLLHSTSSSTTYLDAVILLLMPFYAFNPQWPIPYFFPFSVMLPWYVVPLYHPKTICYRLYKCWHCLFITFLNIFAISCPSCNWRQHDRNTAAIRKYVVHTCPTCFTSFKVSPVTQDTPLASLGT